MMAFLRFIGAPGRGVALAHLAGRETTDGGQMLHPPHTMSVKGESLHVGRTRAHQFVAIETGHNG
ncbi:hypothetical protein OUZ56_013883 [Daphnia magna]|uniref:Uncharacterized protein n=1 Tax=Daphnia magna TaxID=35525 RepID=A0ABQ9Z781_9CRUS|nr:hypothetical protein OUZ56_013883 [Daphnia magna]